MERKWVKNNRGHRWKKDSSGDYDIFAYEFGDIHNGPRCVLCGYGFCHHCEDVPELDCPVQRRET